VALAGGAVFAFVCLVCLVGPLLASALAGIDANEQDIALSAAPPSWRHWMGTDILGRDVMVRTMVGGRIAVLIGLVASLSALAIGLAYGAVAGYAGKKVDETMMRLVDVLYAFPLTAVVIVVMAVTESRGVVLLFVLIAAVSWLDIARITRAQVQGIKRREYVAAARCLGGSPARILARHIVPNALGPVLAYTVLSVPFAMLTEAFLSFLGLGVQAPRASWGTLVAEGAEQMLVYPWLLTGPALVMSVTLLALNFLGDGLREALDATGQLDSRV
jgi:oligopeptide transport system permease protein